MSQPSYRMSQLYHVRMLIFVEEEPQSNKYRQVILSPEQLRAVSDAIAVNKQAFNNGKQRSIEVQLSDQVFKLPDLQDSQQK